MITKPFLNLCADYEDLKGRPFFPGLIKYMASGPVVGMVWQGLDAVKTGRAMLGATNPLNSQPGVSYVLLLLPLVCAKRYLTPHAKTITGTIRGDFALATGRNICHGSDSVENAEKEIKLSVLISFWPRGVRSADVLLRPAGSPRASSNMSITKRRGSLSRRYQFMMTRKRACFRAIEDCKQ